MIAFLFDPVAPAHTSETGVVTFDGAGNFSGTATRNSEGVVTGGVAVTGTYSVAADGTLSVVRGGVTRSGGVLADLSVATAASQSAGSPPGFVLFVRKGGTFTTASPSGEYFIFGYEWKLAPTSVHESEAGAVLLNGAGSLNFNHYDNEDGTVGIESGSATYSIAPDGVVTVTTGTETFSGGALDGGHFVVLGSTTSSADPHVIILVRH